MVRVCVAGPSCFSFTHGQCKEVTSLQAKRTDWDWQLICVFLSCIIRKICQTPIVINLNFYHDPTSRSFSDAPCEAIKTTELLCFHCVQLIRTNILTHLLWMSPRQSMRKSMLLHHLSLFHFCPHLSPKEPSGHLLLSSLEYLPWCSS